MDASSTPWAPEPWLPEGPGRTELPSLRAAITSAAQGDYRTALSVAAALERSPNPGTASAACALRASILRQLHQHDQARVADQRALSHAIGSASSDSRIDALAGLAADAISDPPLALEQWAGLLPLLADASPRARVRAGWVGAEVHLAAGQPQAAAAIANASAGLAAGVSGRHVAKSSLVLGVCWHACGEHPRGIALVRQAALDAADQGLRPLLWPGAYLLACWLPAPEGRRWRDLARDAVASIALDLPEDLLSGWRTDPAVRVLSQEASTFGPSSDPLPAGSLCSHER